MTWFIASGAAGCGFASPGYDGTSYACAATAPLCPPGFTCEGGQCRQGDIAPDPPDAPLAPPAFDATITVPDAAPPVTATFGERPDADHQNVTIDTTITDADPTANDGASERDAIDASPIASTLMRFDLRAIPPGAIVTAASLDVVVNDPIESGTFRLLPLTEAWTEDGATFLERKAGVLWTAPGALTPSSDPTRVLGEIAARAIEPITITLDPAVVQAWVTAPAANDGFVWISTSPDGRGGQIRSREYTDATLRPLLRVTYQP
ncbi:MAG: DNRLRE domain-containing protein [Deltaproteobacteria bacterium]|nr:DNRLRE domain-containing protein [Deltaproteobacteria bacterium]